MRTIRLSICIPTYNFGNFIGETLASIVSQMNDDVEVLVVDGASTDNTYAVVRDFVERFAQVKYYRLETKGGIDIDMAKSVDLATGEYCWLFSGDDVMCPGALTEMLRHIRHGYDLYLCKHRNCSLDMVVMSEHPVLNVSEDAVFNFSSQSDRRRYFEVAQTTEAFFSFMGGIIINRSKWASVKMNHNFVGSCWAHVARIIELMSRGLVLKYIATAYLDRRGDNDSFSDKGIANRYRIAIDGYGQIGDSYFGHDSLEAFHIRRVLRNDFPLRLFLYGKRICHDNPALESRSVLDAVFRKTYSDFSIETLVKYVVYHAYPVWLDILLRPCVRLLKARWVLNGVR